MIRIRIFRPMVFETRGNASEICTTIHIWLGMVGNFTAWRRRRRAAAHRHRQALGLDPCPARRIGDACRGRADVSLSVRRRHCGVRCCCPIRRPACSLADAALHAPILFVRQLDGGVRCDCPIRRPACSPVDAAWHAPVSMLRRPFHPALSVCQRRPRCLARGRSG